MIGAILGGVAGLGNMIAGGIGSAKANKERARLMSEERTRIQNQYDKDYYVDYMNRSDIQSLVKKLQDQSKKRLDNAEATAVVTGATPEAIVAQKQAESEALGQSMSQIAGYSDQWKQQVADRYNQQMSNLMGMQLQENSQKSASYANMVSNGASGIAGAVSGLDGLLDKSSSKASAPVMTTLSAPPIQGLEVPKIKIPTKFGE